MVVVLISSCSINNSHLKDNLHNSYQGEFQKNIDDFISNGFQGEFGRTLDEIKMNFGVPQKIETRDFQNYHSKKNDQIFSINYPGLYLQFYWIREEERGFVFHIIAKSNDYKYSHNVRIGVLRKTILNIFGPVVENNSNELLYFDSVMEMSPENSVSFHFKKDVLQSIEWRFAID